MRVSQGHSMAAMLPSSCRPTGSAGSRRHLPEWQGWSSQPAVSSKASPPTDATTSRPLWETWRSRGLARRRPTGETGAEFINIEMKENKKKTPQKVDKIVSGKQFCPLIACGFMLHVVSAFLLLRTVLFKGPSLFCF